MDSLNQSLEAPDVKPTPYAVVCADILQWSKEYNPDNDPAMRFHAILCDPPYHLISGSRNGSARKPGTGPYGRHREGNEETKGFMGKTWDGGDIAFRTETWEAISRHLLPGGFLMVFGGSRTFHRLACAMEDSGLILHPTVGWVFGSGFPKATRLDTQVDRESGEEQPREIDEAAAVRYPNGPGGNGFHGGVGRDADCTRRMPQTKGVPVTDMAKQWVGHRYGLQALKPALEFIVVAQNPYEGRPIDCITKTGAGALNIEAGRIGTTENLNGGAYAEHGTERHDGTENWRFRRTGRSDLPVAERSDSAAGMMAPGKTVGSEFVQPAGRWPANFVLCHSAPDENGHGGCRRVGVKQVPAVTGGKTSGDNAMGQDAGWNDHRNRPTAISRPGDANGLETVEEWQCVEGCAVLEMSRQSGVRPSCTSPSSARPEGQILGGRRSQGNIPMDTGTASRFFKNVDWEPEAQEQADAGQSPDAQVSPGNGRDGEASAERRYTESGSTDFAATPGPRGGSPQGRWPANFCLCHAPECRLVGSKTVLRPMREVSPLNPDVTYAGSSLCGRVDGSLKTSRAVEPAEATVESWECVEGCPVRELDRQSGVSKSPGVVTRGANRSSGYHMGRQAESPCPSDTDTASRFFQQSDWSAEIQEQLDAAPPFKYQAKASRRERNAGLTTEDPGPITEHGATLRDVENAVEGETGKAGRNSHPCVKPIKLCQWLASLLLPPAAYAPRRILVPFAGSGSEMIGAMLAGWDDIVGVEREAEYAATAEARLAYWSKQAETAVTSVDEPPVPETPPPSKRRRPNPARPTLFDLDDTPEERCD